MQIDSEIKYQKVCFDTNASIEQFLEMARQHFTKYTKLELQSPGIAFVQESPNTSLWDTWLEEAKSTDYYRFSVLNYVLDAPVASLHYYSGKERPESVIELYVQPHRDDIVKSFMAL